jgi:hypothetical protein
MDLVSKCVILIFFSLKPSISQLTCSLVYIVCSLLCSNIISYIVFHVLILGPFVLKYLKIIFDVLVIMFVYAKSC